MNGYVSYIIHGVYTGCICGVMKMQFIIIIIIAYDISYHTTLTVTTIC